MNPSGTMYKLHLYPIKIVIFLFLIGFNSCNQEDNSEERGYVLHADITSSKLVSASFIKFTEIDGQWNNEPIHDAKLYLFENDVQVAQFYHAGFGNYKSGFTAIENNTYKLLAITFENDTVYGEAVIPDRVDFETFSYNVTTDYIDTVYYDIAPDSIHVVDTSCLINLQFSFIDLAEPNNEYQITVRRIDRGCTSYGLFSDENQLLQISKIETNPEINLVQRSKINPYYYSLFDDGRNAEKIDVSVQFYDGEIGSFPVHYAISLVNLSNATSYYYHDLEVNTELTMRLGWDMGFSLNDNYQNINTQIFVPNSKGNTISNGFGFICESAGITDTIVVELPE